MNDEVKKLDALWQSALTTLSDEMKIERERVIEIAKLTDEVRVREQEIEEFEGELIAAMTGKDLTINGTNAETRKVQTVAALAKLRDTDETLINRYKVLASDKLALQHAQKMYEESKDCIEVSRLTLNHIDAVLRALATP